MDETKQEEFRRHVALYAKGWYKMYYNPIDDLFTIAKKTGFEVSDLLGWEVILSQLIEMTDFCFLQLGSEKHDWSKLHSNPSLEFSRFVRFMHANRNEVIEKWGLTRMQTENMDNMDIQRSEHRLLEINLIQALLVTIAKWTPEEDGMLGEPDGNILPLEETVKRKKGGTKK